MPPGARTKSSLRPNDLPTARTLGEDPVGTVRPLVLDEDVRSRHLLSTPRTAADRRGHGSVHGPGLAALLTVVTTRDVDPVQRRATPVPPRPPRVNRRVTKVRSCGPTIRSLPSETKLARRYRDPPSISNRSIRRAGERNASRRERRREGGHRDPGGCGAGFSANAFSRTRRVVRTSASPGPPPGALSPVRSPDFRSRGAHRAVTAVNPQFRTVSACGIATPRAGPEGTGDAR